MPRPPSHPPWTPPVGRAGHIAYRPRPAAAPPPASPARPALPRVATWLHAAERLRVDAAGQDLYHAQHEDSLQALAAALHAGPVGAVLVSAAALDRPGAGHWTTAVAELVRAHPATPVIALVSDEVGVATVFALGRCGLRAAVDVRRPEGWTVLRQALGSARPEVAQLAAHLLAESLAGTSDDTRRFVAALFEVPPYVATVRELARALGVLPTTLMSRFFRARLPAPKRYLAFARLVRAADLLAHPSWTVASVADYMDYSSAQGFSRHLYLLLGVRPAEFRRRFTAHRMLARFADDLLTPHTAVLRDFWPLRR